MRHWQSSELELDFEPVNEKRTHKCIESYADIFPRLLMFPILPRKVSSYTLLPIELAYMGMSGIDPPLWYTNLEHIWTFRGVLEYMHIYTSKSGSC